MVAAARWSAAALLVLVACGADERLPADGAVIDASPDAPIDAGIDADLRCAACTADQICVQSFNGTCGTFAVECQPRNPACEGTACTPACNLWHCRAGGDAGLLTCEAAPCDGAIPGALHCYGP
jgi:hypothetical protein